MEELRQLVMAVISGIENPYLSIAGALAVLFLGIFSKVMLDKMRADKAAREKEKDKERDLERTETSDTEAEGNVNDRLNQRNNNDQRPESTELQTNQE